MHAIGVLLMCTLLSHSCTLLIPVFKYSITVPLFHYCSDCVDQGPCSHHCCRNWLENAYKIYRTVYSDIQKDGNETDVQERNSLMVLAAVATQTERLPSTDLKARKAKAPKGKFSVGDQERMDGKKRTLDLLQQPSKEQKKAKKSKKIIENSLSLVVVNRSLFTERLKVLKKQILYWLHNWSTLTVEQ